ncbi:MAG: dCTP deaminase domain-containing protein [Faecalimonas umbilicata]
MLEGRSSTGRLGLFIHVTAGFGDVGFAGYWTLEIFCVQPIRIYPNVKSAKSIIHYSWRVTVIRVENIRITKSVQYAVQRF